MSRLVHENRNAAKPASIEPLGDRALLARFDSEPEAAAWAASLADRSWAGVVDVVAAYRTVAVHADPEAVDLDDLVVRLRDFEVIVDAGGTGRLLTIPTLYDGIDLPEVARRIGRSIGEVVALHAGAVYRVAAVGFLPGFPYAVGLPGPLAGLPRREPPRTRVPAGSVAIAGRQTGVYPVDSPGGWHLIGRTPLRIADPSREHFPIRSGDRLRFVPIDDGRFAALEGRLLGVDDDG